MDELEEFVSVFDKLWPNSLGLGELRRVVGTALRVMVQDRLPAAPEVEAEEVAKFPAENVTWRKLLLGRKGQGEQVPALLAQGPAWGGTVVVWVGPGNKAGLLDGKGGLTAAARKVLELSREELAVTEQQYAESFALYQAQEAIALDLENSEIALADARRRVASAEVAVQNLELRAFYLTGSLGPELLHASGTAPETNSSAKAPPSRP